MNFILLAHVLLHIMSDVGRSEAGANEISDLLDLVVNLNTRMDDQIENLDKDLEQMKYDLYQPKTAFMAFLSQESLVVSPGQKIVFPDVKLNVNSSYNEKTGVFKAPVSGTYHFAITLTNRYRSSFDHSFHADIVTGDGNRIICSVRYNGYKERETRTISTLVALSAEENVWVKSGNFTMNLTPGKYSFLSGFLVQSL